MGWEKASIWYSEALMGRALCRMAQGQQQAAVADYAAARALAQFPSVTTAKALCKLLQHRDATVRATAADVLLDLNDVRPE